MKQTLRDITARADDTYPLAEQDPPVVMTGQGEYIQVIGEKDLAPKKPGRVCRALRVLLGIKRKD